MAPRKVKEDVNPEIQEAGYQGRLWKVSALARYSRSFTGRCEFGTFRENEFKRGAVQKRVQQLESEGYNGIEIQEIGAE